MSNHAIYSPSAAERWMNCPGSIKAAESIHASGAEHNEATASGTVIHALGEMLLRAYYLEDTDYRPILDHALTEKWGYYADLPPEFAIQDMTHDMVDQAETYLFLSKELVDMDLGDVVGIEKRLTYADNLFGTADLVVIGQGRLLICDLKTGAGNLVWPEQNKQLMTYAGMALADPKLYGIERVELAIIQPPHENNELKVWECTPDDVVKHMVELEQAMLADHMKAGSWCKWCPARASCPTLHALATNAASLDLDGLTPEGWKEALGMAAILKDWCSSVFTRANQLAVEEGLHIPGYKIVQKAGRTTWRSEKDAGFALTEALDEAGVDLLETPQLWNEAKLRTPTQLKKELKGVIDVDIIDTLTHTPDRGLILVTEKDKRPEFESGENLLKAAEEVKFFS